MNNKIFFYNTATRQKEEFEPINEGSVGMYSCGPTVYWNQHIGNMYAFIFDDLIVRTLAYVGYEVKWVMNITDVGHLTSDADEGEDKMEKGAKREGITAWEVAKKYEGQFLESLDALNIRRPDVISRATEHIKEQIELIKEIEANGFTYRTSDGIYYDTSKFPGYGDFAHLNLEMIKEGARVEANPEKKNPSDFALWKFSPKDEKRQMEWESPWGVGFPGWHIECTAMSTKYLGETFDIHTGGEDHIPVHHTNEIAQGYAAFGHQTANVWMHNAFITVAGGKMSKSSGKIMTVQELQEKGYNPLAYRLMAISSHYKKGIDFSYDGLDAATTALERLYNVVALLKTEGGEGTVNEEFKKEFIEDISNDLAMPEAMAVVWKLVKSDISDADKLATLIDFDKVLGLDLNNASNPKEYEVPNEVNKLADERQVARATKNWAESDRLRDVIKEKGYLVEDNKDGWTIVKIKN